VSRRRRWLSVVAVAGAVVAAALMGGRLLLTPVEGDLLVLASGRHSDRLASSTIELHSQTGWTRVGTSPERNVPAAPRTVSVIEARIPVGSYDSLRLGGKTLKAPINVQPTALTPVLVAVTDGQPLKDGLYAGNESVSLGLNELSGQMKQLPPFHLQDQFGRAFDNSSIAGHDVILAAFHTTCHESCPLYTGLFLQLRRQLPPSVLLIEATTDPGDDSPDVLREYAGRVGASWTFLTGEPAALADFWRPFDVQLSTGDVHRSTLALIDSHGYVRSFYLGAPDVGGSLPGPLAVLLNAEGRGLLQSHGNGWGEAQVIDSLSAIGGVASPSSSGDGKAPDFELTTLSGDKVRLSQFRGRPVLINFWATYCVPCRVEMPLLQRLADQHPKLIALLVDERDSTPAARSFIADLRIKSTVLLDTDGKAGDVYRIAGLPTTVFVRSDGSIEGRYLGQTSEQILSPHIAAIGG